MKSKTYPILLILLLVPFACKKPPAVTIPPLTAAPVPSVAEARKIQELEAQLQQLKAKADTTLTREKALSLLGQLKMNPVFKMCYKVANQEGESDKFNLQAEREGYLESRMSGGWKVYTPTAKGQPYQIPGDYPQYRMADLKPQEVIAIGAPSQAGGKTVSQVRFKFLYSPTPMGTIFEQATGHAHLYSGWAFGEATFSLYDDGWHPEAWKRVDN